MQSENGIIAEHTEPIFNVKPAYLDDELLQENLTCLLKENQRRLEKPLKSHTQQFYKVGEAAEYIFNMCAKLKQTPDVKYLAVELFNNFMVAHIYDLYGMVRQSEEYDWLAVTEKVRNQLILRVITCCQLASKLTSHHRVVTPHRAHRTLQEFGHVYNTDHVVQSELRVIKTLDYRLMLSTPLIYIEAMLEMLGRQNEELNMKQYHGLCLKLLDIVYIQHTEIYDHLYVVSQDNNKTPISRIEFTRTESDFVLLAASVISAASLFVDPSHTDKVIEVVSVMGKVDSCDVIDFSAVLVQCVMEEKEQ